MSAKQIRMLSWTACLFSCVMCSTVLAGTLEVQLTDQQGVPLADAVVELYDPASKVRQSGIKEVAQQDLTFRPFVSAVQVGTQIDFPNQDKTRHHVYSFSAIKPFEIKLYVGTPAAPVQDECA